MREDRKGVAPLIPFLAVMFLLFIGILIFVYIQAKHINPQMIQVGRLPVWSASGPPLAGASRIPPSVGRETAGTCRL